MELNCDLVIVGAGPAGMTAAIYAARAGLSVTVVESLMPGGKIVKTYELENYPGFKMINGADLAMNMYEQMTALGCRFDMGEITEIKDHGEYKEVVKKNGASLCSKAVIVATGTQERLLNVPGELEYTSKGVSYCAVCDGSFFKDKQVTVIGGGNSAVEEAIYLTQFAKNVRIVIRRDVFRADEIAQKRLEKVGDKITVVTKHVPVEVVGDGNRVTGIVLENRDTNEKTLFQTDGVFPYIGADPSTSFLQNLSVLDERGYMIVNEKMETSVAGIYGAGDCTVKQLRQVVTACGDGAIAAQNAVHYIRG